MLTEKGSGLKFIATPTTVPNLPFLFKKRSDQVTVVWDTWMIHLVFQGKFYFWILYSWLFFILIWRVAFPELQKKKEKFFPFSWLISFSFNKKSSWDIFFPCLDQMRPMTKGNDGTRWSQSLAVVGGRPSIKELKWVLRRGYRDKGNQVPPGKWQLSR